MKKFILILAIIALLCSNVEGVTKIGMDRLNWSQVGVIDVKDYGAVGDGVADDTTALTNAIAAASPGDTIYLPSTYKITSEVLIDKRIRVQGAVKNEDETSDAKVTIIKDGNFTAINITANSVIMDGVNIEGAAGNGGDGIWVSSYGVTLQHCSVLSMGDDGIVIGNPNIATICNYWTLYDVIACDNGDDGIVIDHITTGGPDTNAGACYSVSASYNGGDGLVVGNTQVNNFHGVLTEGNTGYGIRVLDHAMYNSFWNPHSEANTAGQFIFESGSTDNFLEGSIVFTPVDQGDNAIIRTGGGSNQVISLSNNTLIGGSTIRRSLDQTLGIEGAVPGIYWYNTASDADSRLWNVVAVGNYLIWQITADDEDPAASILTFWRDGTTPIAAMFGSPMGVPDGSTAPSAISGQALIYVDSEDGDLKVKFADGVVKTIAADT